MKSTQLLLVGFRLFTHDESGKRLYRTDYTCNCDLSPKKRDAQVYGMQSIAENHASGFSTKIQSFALEPVLVRETRHLTIEEVYEQCNRFNLFMLQTNLVVIGREYLQKGIDGYSYLLDVLEANEIGGNYTHPSKDKSYVFILEHAALMAACDAMTTMEPGQYHVIGGRSTK